MTDLAEPGTEAPRSEVRHWPWVVATAVIATLLAIVAVAVWRGELEERRRAAVRDLASESALKTRQVVAWRGERLNDARLLTMAGSPLFEVEARPALVVPPTPGSRERLAHRLEQIRVKLGYEGVLLASPEGVLLAGAGRVPETLSPQTQDLIRRAAAARDAVFGEIQQGVRSDGAVGSIDVAAAYRDAADELVAMLLLRSATQTQLFPLLQQVSTGGDSAETLLLVRDGSQVVFLNPLRHVAEGTQARRQPLASSDLVGAKAVRGETGVVQGVDYRGVEVLADLRAVPGSQWFLVAKIDRAEVVADARRRSAAILLITAGVVVTATLLAMVFVTVQRRNAWRARYRAERQVLEEYRATLQGIGDAVLSCDAEGLVRHLNPVAEALTGWTEADARGRPVQEVFRIVDEDTRAEAESPVARVLREGRVVGLADQTLLVARDGSMRPIADSGAPVRRDDGSLAGVVLVFRDQSAERASVNALRASESRLRRLFEGSADAQLLLDMDARTFIDCNTATAVMLGLDDRAEVLGTHPAQLSPPRQPDGRASEEKAVAMIETARREGFHRFEWMHSSRVRTPFPVDVLLTPITEGPPALAVVTWRDLTEVHRVAREREAAAAELHERNDELARFNRAAVGRELRMVELKRELDALRQRVGEAPHLGGVTDPDPDARSQAS